MGGSKLKAEMDVRNPASAILPIIRLVVTAGVAYLALSLLYANGYDVKKDSTTIAWILTALGGVDGVARWIANGEIVAANRARQDT